MAYYENEYRPGGFSILPPAIKALIFANVAIFVLQILTSASQRPGGSVLVEFGGLYPLDSMQFGLWQFVSYMFLHGGFFHIFFNMLMLWMFGAEIENYWGSQQFTVYYFICGIGGGLVNMLLSGGGPVIGASGAVYGILLAFGMMFPDRYVYIYLFLPIQAKYLVVLAVVFEFFAGLEGGGGVAHFAHFGGMAVGYIYIKIMQRELPLKAWFERTFPSNRSYQTPVRPTKSRMDKVDEILDKISRTGYESLTSDEKRALLDASKDRN